MSKKNFFTYQKEKKVQNLFIPIEGTCHKMVTRLRWGRVLPAAIIICMIVLILYMSG